MMPVFPWMEMAIPLCRLVGNCFPLACFSTTGVRIHPTPIEKVWLCQVCMDMINAFPTPKQKLGEK